MVKTKPTDKDRLPAGTMRLSKGMRYIMGSDAQLNIGNDLINPGTMNVDPTAKVNVRNNFYNTGVFDNTKKQLVEKWHSGLLGQLLIGVVSSALFGLLAWLLSKIL